MSTYMIVSLDIDDPEVFKAYQRAVVRTFKVGEGRVLAATGDAERVEGEQPQSWNVIVEFPSKEHAHRWYASPEYALAKPVRVASSSNPNIRLLDGLA